MLIEVLGSFGAGKSSLVDILGDEFNGKKYLEDPNAIPILKEYYKGGKESRKQLSFALQIAWLDKRYTALKSALQDDLAIMDSNLIADSVVYKVIKDRGETTQAEYDIYLQLLRHMLDNVAGDPKGAYPDLYVYLDISPDHEVENILGRGRKMETQDPKLINYYHSINKGFKDWYSGYSQSPVLRIDRDKYDFVNNENDRKEVVSQVAKKMIQLGFPSIGKDNNEIFN